MPHIYVILFIFGAIATISTYLIPSGEFNRIKGPEGREMVDADSFHYIKATPVNIIDFISIIPKGLIAAGEIVFFTLIIGGMFMVLRRTGIIEIGVDKLARKFLNHSIFIIPVLTSVFAIIATLIGTAELSLVYIPVIIPLIIALGYDSITATAIALCGTVVGFTVGVLNPINTGLAQNCPVYLFFWYWLTTHTLYHCALCNNIIYNEIRSKSKTKSKYQFSLSRRHRKRQTYKDITKHKPLVATQRQKSVLL